MPLRPSGPAAMPMRPCGLSARVRSGSAYALWCGTWISFVSDGISKGAQCRIVESHPANPGKYFLQIWFMSHFGYKYAIYAPKTWQVLVAWTIRLFKAVAQCMAVHGNCACWVAPGHCGHLHWCYGYMAMGPCGRLRWQRSSRSILI